MSTTSVRASARERLLDAADELFYDHGVHSVGIDRVIERAGVAKASLYSTFGSKDELIRAYLVARFDERRARMTRELANRFDNPRDRLLGVFDVLGETFRQRSFRGCAFINASAESEPGGSVEEISRQSRDWTRTLFADLAREAGALEPERLAARLMLLYDGALIAASMDKDLYADQLAKEVATKLVANALGRDGKPSKAAKTSKSEDRKRSRH